MSEWNKQQMIEIAEHGSDEEVRRQRIDERNRAVLSASARDYYVDEGLASKLDRLFAPPEPSEADVWVTQTE